MNQIYLQASSQEGATSHISFCTWGADGPEPQGWQVFITQQKSSTSTQIWPAERARRCNFKWECSHSCDRLKFPCQQGIVICYIIIIIIIHQD